MAALVFFDTTENGGVVDKVVGLDILKQADILYYQFNFNAGDFIKRPTDGGNRIGFYVACCKNQQAMEDLMASIEQNVKIIYR